MTKIKVIFTLLCCIAINVYAAPGYQVTSFMVNPGEQANFTAGLAEWMKSDSGKKYKGRVYLQAHNSDGANPATHSIVGVYPSLAESESFGNMVTSNPKALESWMTMVTKLTPISTITSTARFVHMAGWGDLSDKDRVWMQHSFSTKDAPSLYYALDAWMKSDAGKGFPGQMHLAQTLAAGIGAGSHVISIGYESMAEMEKWNATLSGSASFIRLFHTFSVINEYHGASMVVDVNAWGKSLKAVLK